MKSVLLLLDERHKWDVISVLPLHSPGHWDR